MSRLEIVPRSPNRTPDSLEERRRALFREGSPYAPAERGDIVGVEHVLERGEEVLHSLVYAERYARAGARLDVASPAFADMARRLVQAWESEGGIGGSALAVALRAAARAVEEERRQESIEVVWTGPRTTAVPVRLTREVLIDVIRASRESLFVVSFAAYKVDVVLAQLAAAAERGVVIRLILESGEEGGGTLTFDAAKAFDALGDAVAFYVWPTERRPALERGRASLHAKAAIADDCMAFVASANLTGLGISENMELGLLVRGGPIPRRLRDHFSELIAQRILERVVT